jgi:hypothetical protein
LSMKITVAKITPIKRITLLLIFFLTTFNLFGQDENVIKFGSEVTLTLSQTTSGAYNYKITSVKKFNKMVDLDDNSLLAANVQTDQVKLYFCQGGYGTRDQTLLIIKSGILIPLKYIAKIKVAAPDKFESTSVQPLQPNVLSVEMWHWPLEAIILSDFAKAEQ